MTATPGVWQTFSFDGMSYYVLLPDGYSPAQQYPLLLYLHGGGEESTVLEMISPWFDTAEFRTDYPAIIVAPVLQNSSAQVTWGGYPANGTADSQGEDQALAIVQNVVSQYSVDQSRIYVTGLSLGGFGSFDMMIKYNAYDGTEGRIFAAALPLAGAEMGDGVSELPSPAVVSELYDVPIWAINGYDGDQNWALTLAADEPAGTAYQVTFNPTLGHDVWDTYYPLPNGAPYYDWMFSQSSNLGATILSAVNVSAGQTSAGLNITGGDGVIVFAGGTASAMAIGSAGSEIISGGGSSFDATVNNGGQVFVSSGGVASATVIGNGGREIVYGGGFDVAATIDSGGDETVTAGGWSQATAIESGGAETVEAGGTASGAIIAGGTLAVATGGTASGDIAFGATTGGRLQIDGTVTPAATVSGFIAGDTIDLPNVPWSGAGSATLGGGNVLEIVENGATDALDFAPSQSFAGTLFVPRADATGGTAVTLDTARTLVWTGASGTNLASAGNWSDVTDGLSVAAQSPTLIDTLDLLTGGGNLTGSASVAAAAFGGAVSWTMGSGASLGASGGITIGASAVLTSVQVTGGGTVADSGSVADVLASVAGGTAQLTVNGAGSTWKSAGRLVVGQAGIGNLAVNGAGVVQVGDGLSIAAAAGTGGSAVSVVGAGSTLQVTGTLDVAATAAGSLAVNAGGVVTVAGALTVGDAGNAELSILTGATLSATGNATIGNLAGSSGNVDLEGAGSKLSIGGGLTLGAAGLGVLTVGAGATLHVAGALVQGSSGILNIAGGVVDPTDSTVSGPTDLSNGGVYQDLGTLTLKGSIVVDAGVGTVAAQAIKGHGSLVIGNDGTLVLSDSYGGDFGPVAVPSSHPSVMFLANTVDAHPTLAITDLGGFGATAISGFTIGDAIDLPDLGAAITAKALVNTNTVGLYGAGETLLGALVFDTPQAAGYALGTAAQFAAGQAGTIEQTAIMVPTLPR